MEGVKICGTCDGTGKMEVRYFVSNSLNNFAVGQIRCPTCCGAGHLYCPNAARASHGFRYPSYPSTPTSAA